LIADYNYNDLFNQLNSKKVEACGGAAIVTMLMATEKMGAEKVKILMYANSGDVTGDKSSVVGYLSAIAVKQKPSKKGDDDSYVEYSEDERKELLTIARMTIEHVVNRKSIPKIQIRSDKLKENRGAFVTINKFGQLRGCIGYTQPIYPLCQTIQQVAKAAALEDPRFSPVTPNEIKNLELEISVLSLPKKIETIDEIEVGEHGLIIKQNYFQGLLLPQVASDYGWNRTTFLEQTCRKAGLKKTAWKEKNTEIYIFSAEVFGEHE
jgi:AmmeMemoRadiSam system protein A